MPILALTISHELTISKRQFFWRLQQRCRRHICRRICREMGLRSSLPHKRFYGAQTPSFPSRSTEQIAPYALSDGSSSGNSGVPSLIFLIAAIRRAPQRGTCEQFMTLSRQCDKELRMMKFLRKSRN
jgi:hypothetical protein